MKKDTAETRLKVFREKAEDRASRSSPPSRPTASLYPRHLISFRSFPGQEKLISTLQARLEKAQAEIDSHNPFTAFAASAAAGSSSAVAPAVPAPLGPSSSDLKLERTIKKLEKALAQKGKEIEEAKATSAYPRPCPSPVEILTHLVHCHQS